MECWNRLSRRDFIGAPLAAPAAAALPWAAAVLPAPEKRRHLFDGDIVFEGGTVQVYWQGRMLRASDLPGLHRMTPVAQIRG